VSVFNIGFSELVVLLLIAFVIVGPKDLPKVARWLGRMVRKTRDAVREIKKETGLDEFEKEVRNTKADVKGAIADLRKETDVTSEFKDAAKEVNEGVGNLKKDIREADKQFRA